jgi:hypothetical protein
MLRFDLSDEDLVTCTSDLGNPHVVFDATGLGL